MQSKIKTLFSLLFLSCTSIIAQENDSLYTRLQAIKNRDIIFYNVDGTEITSQAAPGPFSPKKIAKTYKQFKFKEKELIKGDSLLPYKNYYVFRSEENPKGLNNNIAYYFIEDAQKNMMAFSFASINKANKAFERKFISLVESRQIPNSVYHKVIIDTINFAGRKLRLGSSCNWSGVNNISCSYYGQMNWSMHKDSADASQTVLNHFESIKGRKNGKVTSDTIVDVIFEGTTTTARRVIYDFTGATSAVVAISGAKTLTIYFVSAPVRGNYLSCVMSFWNSDRINPSGLTPFIEEVMQLK